MAESSFLFGCRKQPRKWAIPKFTAARMTQVEQELVWTQTDTQTFQLWNYLGFSLVFAFRFCVANHVEIVSVHFQPCGPSDSRLWQVTQGFPTLYIYIYIYIIQGSLKDTFCPIETWLFPPKYRDTTIYKAMFRCIM